MCHEFSHNIVSLANSPVKLVFLLYQCICTYRFSSIETHICTLITWHHIDHEGTIIIFIASHEHSTKLYIILSSLYRHSRRSLLFIILLCSYSFCWVQSFQRNSQTGTRGMGELYLWHPVFSSGLDGMVFKWLHSFSIRRHWPELSTSSTALLLWYKSDNWHRKSHIIADDKLRPWISFDGWLCFDFWVWIDCRELYLVHMLKWECTFWSST